MSKLKPKYDVRVDILPIERGATPAPNNINQHTVTASRLSLCAQLPAMCVLKY